MLHQNKGVNHTHTHKKREREKGSRKEEPNREEKVFPVYGKKPKNRIAVVQLD